MRTVVVSVRVDGRRLLREGENDSEGTAFSRCTLHLDLTVVVGDDFFGNGEADACSFVTLSRKERLENLRKNVGSDTGARVGDGYTSICTVPEGSDGQRAAFAVHCVRRVDN